MRGLRTALVRRAREAVLGLQPRAVILLYHRVAQPFTDPQLLCVSETHFAAQMDLLRREYAPVSLAKLVEDLRRGSVQSRSVAVTFDDGYADNLHRAAPILASAGVPATVFVAPGLSGREAYHDRLEHLILRAKSLPARIVITADGRRFEWPLDGWQKLPAGLDETYWRWNADSCEPISPRQRAYLELFMLMRASAPAERVNILAQLEAIASETAPCEEHRHLLAEEVRELAARPGIDIGAHTMSHPVLCRRPAGDQFAEMGESKRVLERELSRPVDAFAYPYGSAWDVSLETVGLTAQAGFTSACANQPGPVYRGSDPFWLPRHGVRDWPADEFCAWLESSFRPILMREPVGCP